MFLSPQPEAIKRPKLTDGELNRNLGLEFSLAGGEAGELGLFNLDMFTKHELKTKKNLTPETNYTNQSGGEKLPKFKGKSDYSIWDDLTAPKRRKGSAMKEKPALSKPKPPKRNLMKDLGKDLGLGFSSSDFNPPGSTDLGLICDNHGNYLAGNMSVLADLTLFSSQKPFVAPNQGLKMADNYSVGSHDTPFPSYP